MDNYFECFTLYYSTARKEVICLPMLYASGTNGRSIDYILLGEMSFVSTATKQQLQQQFLH